MSSTSPTPAMALLTAPPPEIQADLLVFPWFEQERPGAFGNLDHATGGQISRALGSRELSGKYFEVFVTPIVEGRWKAARIALVGAGPEADFTTDLARKLATTAVLAARQRRVPAIPSASRDRSCELRRWRSLCSRPRP